jgi:FKBP-type peptidyl-prolyl cis-trans isomerase
MPMPRAIALLLLILLAVPAGAQTIALEPPADLAAPPPDAEQLSSGLATRVLRPGNGATTPAPSDFVTLNFAGWTGDGNLIDNSGAVPPMFPLNRTLPGFRECVGLMSVGEHRRCWVPAALGYQGQAGRPAGPLVFDVELLEVRQEPTIAPDDVAAPPADVTTTASGLAWRQLRPGTGTRRPTAFSQVRVHYTGWTTDGLLFDSSLNSGRAATLRLPDLITGWQEGLQLMTVGERTRFWIPEDLAYEGQEGAPAGMLVFDVELVAIDN